MSQENAEAMLRVIERWGAHDPDLLAQAYHPNVEYFDRRPFGTGEFQGRDRMREMFASIFATVPDLTSQGEVVATEGGTVLTRQLLRGHAPEGGGEAVLELWALDTFRDGLIVQTEVFDSRDEALDALGVSD